MDNNHKKHTLDLLTRIKKVEAPPFLYTRIKGTIENKSNVMVSSKVSWTMGLSFILVLILNVSAIEKNTNLSSPNGNLIFNMNLMPENNIYK